jgi:hypothetical protein
MVDIELDKINSILDQLKGLKIKEAVSLRKRLVKEKQTLEVKEESKIEVTKFPKITRAQKISRTLKKRFRYLRLIRDQFPEMSIRELNKQLTRRQKGLDTDVPDVAWQNPSP